MSTSVVNDSTTLCSLLADLALSDCLNDTTKSPSSSKDVLGQPLAKNIGKLMAQEVLSKDFYEQMQKEVTKHKICIDKLKMIAQSLKTQMKNFDEEFYESLRNRINNRKVDWMTEFAIPTSIHFLNNFRCLLELRQKTAHFLQTHACDRHTCILCAQDLERKKVWLRSSEEQVNSTLQLIRTSLEIKDLASRIYDCSDSKQIRDTLEFTEKTIWPRKESTVIKKKRIALIRAEQAKMAKKNGKPSAKAPVPPSSSSFLSNFKCSEYCEHKLRPDEEQLELCEQQMTEEMEKNEKILLELGNQMAAAWDEKSEEVDSQLISKQVEKVFRMELAIILEKEQEICQHVRNLFREIRVYSKEFQEFNKGWLTQLKNDKTTISTTSYPRPRVFEEISDSTDEMKKTLREEAEIAIGLLWKLEVEKKESAEEKK